MRDQSQLVKRNSTEQLQTRSANAYSAGGDLKGAVGRFGQSAAHAIDAVGGPKDPAQHLLLAAELDRIRKIVVLITSGEVDQGSVCVAVSIQNKSFGINASLSLIFAASEFNKVNDHTLTALLTPHAGLIENFIEDTYHDILCRLKP